MNRAQRDTSIDILRAIALMGLVVAHTHPSDWLFQLRNFDVPMMVFLSGVSYSMTSNRATTYAAYVIKRFVRIIIPTWIFLVIYYRGLKGFSLAWTIGEFDLMTGWYVWIMRVFFIIAVFAPLASRVVGRFSHRDYFVCLMSLLLLNEMICRQPWAQGSIADINVIILMNLPYLLVFSLGLLIMQLGSRQIAFLLCVAAAIYISFAIYLWSKYGGYVLTQSKKYPPQLYYLSYASAWICGLWLLRNSISRYTRMLKLAPLLTFIGSHTMWIYFWHIVAIDYFSGLPAFWMRFLVVLTVSLAVVYLQHLFVSSAVRRLPAKVGKYAKIVFDG